MKTRFFYRTIFFLSLMCILGGIFVFPKSVLARMETIFIPSSEGRILSSVSTVATLTLSAQTENSISWRDVLRAGFGILTVRADTTTSVYELGFVGVFAPFFVNPFVTAVVVVIGAFSVAWLLFLLAFPPERTFLHWHAHKGRYVLTKRKQKRVRFTASHKHSLFLAFTSFGFLAGKIVLVSAFGSLFLRVPEFSFADSTGSAAPEGVITYTARYTIGSEGAFGFAISDHWPTGVTYVVGSARVNGQPAGSLAVVNGTEIVFSLGDREGGEDGSVSWQVKVSSPSGAASVSNRVRFAANGLAAAESNTVTTKVVSLTLSGKVFSDLNGNQTLDASSEGGLNGVEIRLYKDTNSSGVLESAVDTLVTKQTTAVQGSYSFTGLAGGTYFVRVQDSTLPDSRYKRTTENPLRLTVRSGQSKSSQDFGYALPSSEEIFTAHLGDMVWEDDDRDGKFDNASERALSDVTLFLWRDADRNGTLSTADTFMDTTRTDGDGWYDFSISEKGKYFISVDETTLPKGYSVTTNNLPYVRSFDANSGSSQVADFGFARPTSAVGDQVFSDTNKNRIQDMGEKGVAQVNVRLYRDTNGSGRLEAGDDALVDEILTNDSGRYSFENVESDVYFVQVDENTLPLDGTLTTGKNPYTVDVSTDSGEEYMSADFGYFSQSVEAAGSGGGNVTGAATNNSSSTAPVHITNTNVAPAPGSEISASSSTEDVAPVISEEEPSSASVSDVDEVKEGVTANETSDPSLPVAPSSDVVLPPSLTFMNGKPVSEDSSFSHINGSLELAGFAQPFSQVVLKIFSDDPVSYAVTADEEGYWTATLDVFLLASGTHRVYAQTRTADGKSFVEELGYFTVQFDYADDRLVWMVMGVLIAFSSALSLFISRSRIFYGYMSKDDLKKGGSVDIFASLEKMNTQRLPSEKNEYKDSPTSHSKTSP